jgi:hypothetical protein
MWIEDPDGVRSCRPGFLPATRRAATRDDLEACLGSMIMEMRGSHRPDLLVLGFREVDFAH